MSRNIKEIGKELLGKSLNSYHRRTGLTQLEKNNNIQDGILDGILSQVDDAYIEKTEQSNVIHLEGSGDGAVVVDEIEGNTLVNLIKMTSPYIATVESFQNANIKLNQPLKANTVYTRFYHVKTLQKGDVIEYPTMYDMVQGTTNKQYSKHLNSLGWHTSKFTNLYDGHGYQIIVDNYWRRNNTNDCKLEIDNFFILEGDWTDKPMPTHFEGLQSSFEEKVNDEGKYEIEILMKNKNLFDTSELYQSGYNIGIPITSFNSITLPYKANSETGGVCMVTTKLKKGVTYTFKVNNPNENCSVGMAEYLSKDACRNKDNAVYSVGHRNYITSIKFTPKFDNSYIVLNIGGSWKDGSTLVHTCSESENYQLEVGDTATKYTPKKQNKIKLLINEPLRALSNGIKDKLCIKDGKLFVERNCKTITFNGVNHLPIANNTMNSGVFRWTLLYDKDIYTNANNLNPCICDKYATVSPSETWGTIKYLDGICVNSAGNSILLYLDKYKDGSDTSKQNLINDLKTNPVTVVYRATQPVYEEVLNEYGEPVMLEGYENGTIYIDSTIVPTTTLRYTPKMESLKTLKAVNHNNIMLTDDINNNIIDYMMNVDLMIMEKEMQITKTRRIGEKDMTNMQKRTFDMLKRLIKGKTLTEQECKDRVVLYLSAEKITSEQAEELMLYISEIYA